MTATYSSKLLSSVWAKRPTVFHCNIQWPLLYFFHRNKKFKSLKAKTFKVRFACSHFCGKQFLSLPTKTRAVNFEQFTESALAPRLPGDMSSKSMKCQETAWDEPLRELLFRMCCVLTLPWLLFHGSHLHPPRGHLTPLCSDRRVAGCSWGRLAGAAWKMTVSFRGLCTSLVIISLIREAPGTWLLGFYLGWGLFCLPLDNPGFHPIVIFREND